MAKLRDFQSATANRINAYFGQENNHRYLLADEVGLGKTLIAADVIDKFAKQNKEQNVDSVVYYVCGNLALIAQNEKKLRDGFESYNSYMWKENRHEDMSRLGLSFVRSNYLKEFDTFVEIEKAVAVWMLGKDFAYTTETFYRKNGDFRTLKEDEQVTLITKLFGQRFSFCNRYQNKLEKSGDKYHLLLELYGKIKGKVLEESVKEQLKAIDEILPKYQYINTAEKYQNLSDEEKDSQREIEKELLIKLLELVPIYDRLAETKKISFQSLTPRTSLEKTSGGTWIERAAAGIVYYKWKNKSKSQVSEADEEKFEKEFDALIRGAKSAGEYEDVLPVIKTGAYRKAWYGGLQCTNDAQMAMFLYQNITDDDVTEVMKDLDIPNILGSSKGSSKEQAQRLLKRIMERMALYSLQQAKDKKKVLVVVDEFQNYSAILGTKDISEECARVREELLHNQDAENHYVLLLSATPFHFANANVAKTAEYQSGLEQIDSEVDLILNYVMGEETYKAWLKITDMEDTYKRMYQEGISRTERLGGTIVNDNMTLSYDNDRDLGLLKSDITTFSSGSNLEVAMEPIGGDLVIYYRGMYYLYRNGRFFLASGNIIEEIAYAVGLYDEEDEAVFYDCFIYEDDEIEGEDPATYERREKIGKEEKRILKQLSKLTIPLSYRKDTPWILSFAKDYKISMTSTDEAYILQGEKIRNYEKAETKHARFQKLKHALLEAEDQAYKLLYIPPSKPDYKLWGVYEKFDNAKENAAYYSKSLIFSENFHTPRALSAMLSYESERLNHSDAKENSINEFSTQIHSNYEKRVRYDLKGEEWVEKERKSEKRNNELIEAEIIRYCERMDATKEMQPYEACIRKAQINREEDSFCLGSLAGYFLDMGRKCGWKPQLIDQKLDASDEILTKLKTLLTAIYSVFTTKEAHDILSLIAGDTYMDRIYAYSAQGNLRSVLDEYIQLIIDEEHMEFGEISREKTSDTSITEYRKLLKVLYEDYFSVIEKYMQGKQFKVKAHTADGSSMDIYTGFAQGITGDDGKVDTQKALKNKITCFNSPFRPFVFTTTSVGAEGLDFHWFCRNIYHWALEMNPEKFQQKEGRINRFHCHCVRQNLGRDFPEKSWEEIYQSVPDGENPFCPEWIYEGKGDKAPYARLSRNTCYYPGSYEDKAYEEMIRNMEIYREIINGQYLSPYYLDSYN